MDGAGRCVKCPAQGQEQHVFYVLHWRMASGRAEKHNITVKLRRETLRKAKLLAARREMSISGLLEHQIEALVGADEAYERARRRALALLEEGFHLGGRVTSTRDEWHER